MKKCLLAALAVSVLAMVPLVASASVVAPDDAQPGIIVNAGLQAGGGVKDVGFIEDGDDGTRDFFILLNNGELYRARMKWPAIDVFGSNGNTDSTLPTFTATKIADNVKSVMSSHLDLPDLFFIKNDNTLWGYGHNKNYALGLGHDNRVTSPVKILDNVDELHISQSGNCVLKSDGTVWAFGIDRAGKFTTGLHNKQEVIRTANKILDNVKQISNSNDSLFYLTNDNEFYVTGCLPDPLAPNAVYLTEPYMVLDQVAYFTTVPFYKEPLYDNWQMFRTDGTVWGFQYNAYMADRHYYKQPIQLEWPFGRGEIVSDFHFIKEDHSLWLSGGIDFSHPSLSYTWAKSQLGIELAGNRTPEHDTKILDSVKEFYFDLGGSGVISAGAVLFNGDVYAWGFVPRFYEFNRDIVSSLGNDDVSYKPIRILQGVSKLYSIAGEKYFISLDGSLYYCHTRWTYQPIMKATTDYIKLVAGKGQDSSNQIPAPPVATPPASEPAIIVTVNGLPLQFDQPPIMENGRTLVPLRAIFEALGATVDWNGSTQTVAAKKDDITITLSIGSTILMKNGQVITLDVPARTVNGRTLVPTRAVAESFEATVVWEPATRTVMITTAEKENQPASQLKFNENFN